MLEFLEHHASSAFAHDETIAIAVIRARGLLRPVVEAGRQGATGAKARERKAIDGRFRAAGDHHVGVAKRDQPPGVADRVRAGRASGDDRVVGALEIVGDRNLPAQKIDEPSGNKERRDPARPFFVQGDGGVVDAAKTTDTRSEKDAGLSFLLVGFGSPIRVAQRLGRCAHAVNDEVVDPALFLRLHPVVRIEGVRRAVTRHLRGDLAGEVGNIEVLDPRRRRLAGEKASPRRLDPAGQWGHHAETRNDDPPHLAHACTLAVPICIFQSRRAAAPRQCDKGRTGRRPHTSRKSVLMKAGPGPARRARRYFLVDAFSRYLTASPTVTMVSA